MNVLIYSNLYVSLCAASLTVATRATLTGTSTPDALGALVFFATLLVYNLDRVAGTAPEDAHDPSPRQRWIQAHRRPLLALTGAAALGVAACAWILPWYIFLALVPLGVLSLAYSLPIFSWGGQRGRRLKELPGVKIFLIATVWAVATVTLPGWLDGVAPWSLASLSLMIERALFIFAITLPFDVRDMEKDRAARIVTLPHLLGVSGTRQLAVALLAVGWLLGALVRGVTAPATLGLLASALTTIALLSRLRADNPETYHTIWLEGTMLARTLLVLAAVALL